MAEILSVDCDYLFCDDPREHAHCLECGELIAKTEFLCPACA
jgi:hypothetical protein